MTRWVSQPANRSVRPASGRRPKETEPGRLAGDRDDSCAWMIDEVRRLDQSGCGLNEPIRRVVVDDLSCAGAVDGDHEEVSEVAVALTLDAARAHQTDVVVVHGMRRDLNQGLR